MITKKSALPSSNNDSDDPKPGTSSDTISGVTESAEVAESGKSSITPMGVQHGVGGGVQTSLGGGEQKGFEELSAGGTQDLIALSFSSTPSMFSLTIT